MTLGAKIRIAAGLTALLAQAGTAHANVSFVCPSMAVSSGELSVKVGSGYMTGMARYKDNDLHLEVDQQHVLINVTGSINYHPLEATIVTQDCAGARQIVLKAAKVEARRYTVLFNGAYLGTADMLEEPRPKSCMYVDRHRRASSFASVNRQMFVGWSGNPIDGWREWRADDVFALLSPLLTNHPESLEGRPQVDLKIDKRVWNMAWPQRDKPWKSEPFVAAWLTRHGFLDDSVSGNRYFAELRHGADGWRINELFGQQMCARGDKAGQWVSDSCQ